MTTPPSFRSPAGGIYYHYTTRSSAQEMSMAGYILLGRTGRVYLTDVLYKLGWQATDRLALPEKNAELVIPIPEGSIGGSSIDYQGIVPEWPAGSGRSLRRGGGHQRVATTPIQLSIFPWSWIELEVP